jgi:hypothetical protein
MLYTFRTKRGKSLVIVESVDSDFPESDEQYDLCKCPYTQALFERRDGIVLGAVLPQVTKSFLCHPLAGDSRKRSKEALDELDANCNTCCYLERVNTPSSPYGFLYGRCRNPHMFIFKQQEFSFHPNDYMGMPCYKSRKENHSVVE